MMRQKIMKTISSEQLMQVYGGYGFFYSYHPLYGNSIPEELASSFAGGAAFIVARFYGLSIPVSSTISLLVGSGVAVGLFMYSIQCMESVEQAIICERFDI